MKSIWIAEHGEYSGRYVCGAYSSFQKAIEHGNDESDITEMIIDEEDEIVNLKAQGLQFYDVMMFRDGRIRFAKLSDHCCARIVPVLQLFDGRIPGEIKDLRVFVWAKNREHAIKSVNEIRTKMIALNQWD